jgi:hypothetical protein
MSTRNNKSYAAAASTANADQSSNANQIAAKARTGRKGKENDNTNDITDLTNVTPSSFATAPTIDSSTEDSTEVDTSMEISPVKKKRTSRKGDSSSNQKDKTSNQKEPSMPQPETPARSSLKQGRYGTRPSTPAPERMHLHEHSRIIIEAAFAFGNTDDRFKSFLSASASMLTFARMVDEHFVINPVKEGGRDKDWSDPSKLPKTMTALGAYFALSGNARIFENTKANIQGKGKKDNRPPTVYFTFAVSSDIPPDEIIARISVDWTILGGTRLAVKKLGYFETCTPIVIYFLWNEGHAETLLEELKMILSTASSLDSDGATLTLPPMSLRKQIPRIPGQATEKFNHLSYQAQMARRTWHIEVETKHAVTLIELVRKAKTTNSIYEVWGRQVHFSEVADHNTPTGELKRYVKFAQRHVNFHCSMTCEDLRGIVYLDAIAPVYCEITNKLQGTLSLRQVLLKYLKMSDGTSLVAEIHQRGSMGIVEIVVPNTAEAEAMVMMMNRQFPAFCHNYFIKNGMTEAFVKTLLKEACCPTLVASISACVWDSETNTISTPEQLAEDARMAEIEKAAWYKDEFGKHMVAGMKKLKTYTDPEALYNLDGERSVRTLHARNDPKPTLDVEEDTEDEEDDDFSEKSSDSESISLGDLSLDMSEVEDLDVTMDSASKSVKGRSSRTSDADEDKTRTNRVGWHSASSVDESAPVSMTGGG